MGLDGIYQFLDALQKAINKKIKLSSDVNNTGLLVANVHLVQIHKIGWQPERSFTSV